MSSSPRWSHRSHHQSSSPDTWHMAHLIGSLIRYGGRHCACSGVFVICSVVDDDEANTIQSLLCPRRRLCRSLRRQWRRQYEFIQFCACGSVFVVCSVVDDNEADTIQQCCAFSSVFFVQSVIDDDDADTIQSCWKPTWSSFHRIAAVGQSTPIAIYSLTLIVLGSTLVIHRAFALILYDVSPYASLWVW